MSDRYKIVRYYQNGHKRTIKTNLSLSEAQAHCRDPETNYKTATGKAARSRTRSHGPWFDGYTKCTK